MDTQLIDKIRKFFHGIVVGGMTLSLCLMMNNMSTVRAQNAWTETPISLGTPPETITPSGDIQDLATKRIGIQAGDWQLGTGEVCNGTREVDINLAVANKAAEILRSRGYTVDVLADLATADYYYSADVFVVLHVDWCGENSSGYKISRWKGRAGLGTDGSGDASDRWVNTLWSAYGTATGLPRDTTTTSYSACMREYFALNPVDWGPVCEGQYTQMHGISDSTPGAIIEMGWLSGDYDFVTSTDGQQKMATGIANAADQFLGAVGSVPYAPSNMQQTSATQTSIAFSWSTHSTNESGFYIYRWDGSTWVNINSNGANATNYTDSSLNCGTMYYYDVSAYNSYGESNSANPYLTAQTSSCGSPPITPSSPNPSDGQTLGRTTDITLYWTTSGTSCDISISGEPNINIDQTGVSCSSFSFGQPLPGSYQWQVTAHSSFGTTTGPTWHFNIQPYAPTNLSASAPSQTQINLSWTKSSDDPSSVDSYDVYYSNGSLITNIGAGFTSYQISGLTCNNNYSFYVKAVRQGVESNATNTASATTTGCPPNAPSNLIQSGAGYNNVTLLWNDNSKDEDGFNIYRWDSDPNGKWEFYLFDSVGVNITSFTNSQLNCGSSYFYQVSAYNNAGESTHTYWTIANTSTCSSSTAPTPSPTLPNYLDDRSTPSQVIVSFANAINRQEYLRAYNYWAHPTTSLGSFTSFSNGYSDTASVDLVFGQITGDGSMGQIYYTIPVILKATAKNDTHTNYAACYVVHEASPDVYSAPPIFPMSIDHGSAQPSDINASDASVLATACSGYPVGSNPPFPPSSNGLNIDKSNFIDNRSGPIETVSSLLNALNLKQYVRAYSYYQDPATFPGPYDSYAAGYSDTGVITVTFGTVQSERVAGYMYYKVPLATKVLTTSNTTQTFVGCYTLHLAQPAMQDTPPFQPMGIISGKFNLVDNSTDVNTLLPAACNVLSVTPTATPSYTPTYTPTPTSSPTFTNTPPIGSSFIFASMGDAQNQAVIFLKTTNQIASLNPAFVIFNGDLEQNGVASSEINQMVADLRTSGIFNKTFLIRGNHDNVISGSAGLWESYFETSPNIKIFPSGVTEYVSMNSSSDTLTYSFIYGNSIFIGLDVPGDVGLLTSSELTFLDSRLTYAESRGLVHAFIYFHGPMYCVESNHCTCSTKTDASCTPTALVSIINKHPIVSAFLHGHEHILGWTHMDKTRLASLTSSFEEFFTSPSGGTTYNADLFPARMDYHYPNMGSSDEGFATILVNGKSFTFSIYKVGTTTPVWSRTFTK